MAAAPSVANADPNFRHRSGYLLQRALILAQEAVQLDHNNPDPRIALPAYGRAIVLIHEVMSKARAELGVEAGVNPITNPNVPQNTELSSMEAIYDNYLSRMDALKTLCVHPNPTDTTTSN